VAHDLTICVNEPHTVRKLAKIAAEFGKKVPIHIKIHTGMSRYGVRWDEALPLVEKVVAEKSLSLEGLMMHFSQSDETDKTFANLQFARFSEVLRGNASVTAGKRAMYFFIFCCVCMYVMIYTFHEASKIS
jgi:alanine racemase